MPQHRLPSLLCHRWFDTHLARAWSSRDQVGADLAEMIHAQCVAAGTDLVDGDVVIVTSKIVSKAEGAIIELDDIVPSPFAASWSEAWEKDRESLRLCCVRVAASFVNLVQCSSLKRIMVSCVQIQALISHPAVLTTALLCLPKDPDASARRMRARFNDLGANVAVLISDTFGRPWREGQTDICVGLAGMHPMRSYIGEVDPHGHEFKVQELCVVDEVTAAAELVKGNTSRPFRLLW